MSDPAATLAGRPVLVTGASGFLGTRLCQRLTAAGVEVHGVSRQDRQSGESAVRWWRADFGDEGRIAALLASVRPAVVFHLAGVVTGRRDRELVLPVLRENLLATIHLMSVASESGYRVVLAGSMEEPTAEGGGATPCSPYAAAKWAASGYARMFSSLYDLDVRILRIFMVYGPGRQDPRRLIPYVTQSLLRGETPQLSSGRRRTDWVYVDDVVEALIRAGVAKHLTGTTIDIGSGVSTTVREIAERLAILIGGDVAPGFDCLPDRPLETEERADTATAERLLGWKPRVALAEGLAMTVDWFRQLAPDLVSAKDRFS